MDEVITGIDHPIVAVRDMAAARAAYERLGFTVTPRGTHLEWGTGNWCIMFEDDYIELRGVIDSKVTHDLGQFLQHREGLMGLALGIADAEASYAALLERGLHPQPVRRLRRNFELPEGTVQPTFALCFLPAAETTGLMSVVLCQHLTPELLRRPDWLRHANGARAVRSVWGVVPDLAMAADGYMKLFGTQAITQPRDRLVVHLNRRQSILLMTRDAAQDAWPRIDHTLLGEEGGLLSVTIEVTDVNATQQYFASHGIDYDISSADSLHVLPQFSCGVPLEFVGQRVLAGRR